MAGVESWINRAGIPQAKHAAPLRPGARQIPPSAQPPGCCFPRVFLQLAVCDSATAETRHAGASPNTTRRQDHAAVNNTTRQPSGISMATGSCMPETLSHILITRIDLRQLFQRIPSAHVKSRRVANLLAPCAEAVNVQNSK